MKNLTKRLLTAAVAVPLLLFVFNLGGLYYLAFICAIAVLSSIEFFSLVCPEMPRWRKAYITSISALLCVSAFFGLVLMSLLFTVFVLASIALEFRKEDFTDCLKDLGVTFIPFIYFGWMLSHGVLLRDIGSHGSVSAYASMEQGLADPGFFFVVLAVSCTFLNDAGAFFFGKAFGEKRLARHISAGKTVAGLVGGFFASVVCAIAVNLVFHAPLPLAWAILYAVIIVVVAVAGDLFESIIKRSVGAKDSGFIVPGHGGVLDRFDSLIFVFPFAYYVTLAFYRVGSAYTQYP